MIRTRRFFNAVSGQTPINRIMEDTTRKDNLYVNIKGKNMGYKVGEEVTIYDANKNLAFTGKIWYIYQGSTAFNLYIKSPNAKQIAGQVGGVVVMKGAPAPMKPAPTSTVQPVGNILRIADSPNPPTASASTILQQQREEQEQLMSSSPVAVPANPITEPEVTQASFLPAGIDQKTMLIIGAGIVGIVLLKKFL